MNSTKILSLNELDKTTMLAQGIHGFLGHLCIGSYDYGMIRISCLDTSFWWMKQSSDFDMVHTSQVQKAFVRKVRTPADRNVMSLM